jgi:predicted MPP superfamily phosphohydrolase
MLSPVGHAILRFGRAIHPPDQKDWVDVTPIRLKLPRLNPAFHGFRVVQISDFHIGTWIDRRHLEEAVDLVNAQQPDLVAITGDFVTFHPERYASTLIGTLKKLSPRVATLAILGNHDHWTDPKIIRAVIREVGAVDLSNRIFTVNREGAKLHFAGVDDYMDNRDRLDLVLKALPRDREAAVLLAHEPDFADLAAKTGRFDLQISGHSHGGQIRVPLLGAPFLPRFARKYPSGLYRVKGLTLYTNRGLGTAEFNVRWNCRPEITVFTFVSPRCTDPNGEEDRF